MAIYVIGDVYGVKVPSEASVGRDMHAPELPTEILVPPNLSAIAVFRSGEKRTYKNLGLLCRQLEIDEEDVDRWINS